MHWVCLIMQWACQTFLFGWQVNLFWPVYAQRMPQSIFSIKTKFFCHCVWKSNLLIYLAVHIQFVPVYIHTHFKDGYQHHQFLPILNTHHQTSSPIIRYHDSQYFFTVKHKRTTMMNLYYWHLALLSLPLLQNWFACQQTFSYHHPTPTPHHTLMHNASSSSKRMMMMMTY